MALWKDPGPPQPTFTPPSNKEAAHTMPETLKSDPDRLAFSSSQRPDREMRESVIASGLTIEGKIEGAGNIRIAGKFKGDVHVEGNLTIDSGAKLNGAVRANTVTVGGELEGNIDAANRVELLETGVLTGDVKAASLIVAAGSRMRGQVEFGWDNSKNLDSRNLKTPTVGKATAVA